MRSAQTLISAEATAATVSPAALEGLRDAMRILISMPGAMIQKTQSLGLNDFRLLADGKFRMIDTKLFKSLNDDLEEAARVVRRQQLNYIVSF